MMVSVLLFTGIRAQKARMPQISILKGFSLRLVFNRVIYRGTAKREAEGRFRLNLRHYNINQYFKTGIDQDQERE